MFIEFARSEPGSFVGTVYDRKLGDMPLLRSFTAILAGFYRHVAPTALKGVFDRLLTPLLRGRERREFREGW